MILQGAWFSEYYIEQRQAQMRSDLQMSSSKRAFLEHYQGYLIQLAGFFLVEDLVMRTSDQLTCTAQVRRCLRKLYC